MAERKNAPPAAPAPDAALPPRGRLLALAGGIAAFLGLFVLSFADPLGADWASRLCPFLVLGGYLVLFLGLLRLPPRRPTPGL